MSVFKFRLQRVLDYKQILEDQKKLELARHVAVKNKIQIEMDECLKKKEEMLKMMNKIVTNAFDLNLCSQTLRGIEQTFLNGKKKLLEIQKIIDAATAVYVKARQDKEAFVKLKEKDEEKFKKEEKMKMEKEIEKAATNLWTSGNLKDYELT